MRKYFISCLVLLFTLPKESYTQGIVRSNKKKTIHLIPDPSRPSRPILRIEDLDLYDPSTDTTILSYNPISGIVNYIKLSSLGDNLGNHIATRNIQMGSNWLSNDGNDEGIFIQSDGDVGLGTNSPEGQFSVVNDANVNGFNFISGSNLTGERDVFTINDQDPGGGGQDHSSVLKVFKSANINSGDLGFSLIEATYSGADPGDNKYWISGRKTDESSPEWGVNISDNQIWSSGGIVLNASGATTGSYSGGNFIVQSDGKTGIGTLSPQYELEVSGTVSTSSLQLTNGASTGYLLQSDASGNASWVAPGNFTNTDAQSLSLNSYTLSISNGNSINLEKFLDNTDEQTLSLNSDLLSISNGNSLDLGKYLDNTDSQSLSLVGNSLSIKGGNTVDLSSLSGFGDDLGNHTAAKNIQLAGNWIGNDGDEEGVYIAEDGKTGIGTSSPTEQLEVNENTKLGQHLYVGPNGGTGDYTLMRLGENFNADQNTYQLYSNTTISSPNLSGDRTSYGAYFNLKNSKTENVGAGFDSDAVSGLFQVNSGSSSTYRNMYGVQGFAQNSSNESANLGNLYGGFLRAYNASSSATVGNIYGGLLQSRGKTNSAVGITNAYGGRGEFYPYAANVTNAFGLYGYTITNNGHAGDINNAYGVYGRVRVDSDDGGDITTARAGYFLTDRRASANLMTTAYGIQVDANDAQTIYGIRVDTDDADATSNYGIYLDAGGAANTNYGIYGERGDWVLDQDGDGNAGGTGSGGDLILGEGQDLEIYHDGSSSYIQNNTGDLYIGSSSNDVLLSTSGGKVGIGTNNPSATLQVAGGNVRFSDYGSGKQSGTPSYQLGVNSDGDIIEVNTYKASRIFYPPPIEIDASAVASGLSLDLHQEYINQYSSPSVSSPGAPASLPTYGESELYYYVTAYDNSVLSNISLNAKGVMTYDVSAVPTSDCTYITVVFLVK